MTVTYWESGDVVLLVMNCFSQYCSEDHDFLLEFEPKVQHFDVAAIEHAA